MAHIQIDDIDPDITYTVGASARSVFTVPFAFFENEDLIVTVGDEIMVLTDDYTVTGAGLTPPSVAAVTLDVAVTNTTVRIERDVPIKRTTDFPASGPFQGDAMNTQLDKFVAMLQQIARRAMLTIVGSNPSVWDAQGRRITDIEDATDDTDAVTRSQLLAALAQPAVDSSANVFESRAAVGLTEIAGTINHILTLAYTSGVRGGGATYMRVASQPSHAGKIQSADGAWWELDLYGRVDVRAFGVRADGTTDDTDALQDAINSGAGWLDFPAGTILVDNTGIFGVSNQVWQGAGRGATIIKLTANTSQEMIAFASKTKSEIRDMTLDYNNRVPTGNLSVLAMSACTSCDVTRVNVDNGVLIGFAFDGCEDVTVEACTISRDTAIASNNQAITFVNNPSQDFRILRNRFYRWGANAGDLTDSWWAENIAEQWIYGAGIGQGGAGFTDNRIIYRNNIIRDGSTELTEDVPTPLRPHGLEIYTNHAMIEGNILYNNGGSAIRSAGSDCIVANNLVYNNGLRSLIAPSEEYVGLDIRYLAADVAATRVVINGNLVHSENSNIQKYGLQLLGSPLPSYVTISGNAMDGGTAPIDDGGMTFSSFVGPALFGAKTFDPANLTNGSRDSTSVSVSGAALGDKVTASFSLDLQGIDLFGYVSSANTVTVIFHNATGGTLNLASGTLRVTVWKGTGAANF